MINKLESIFSEVFLELGFDYKPTICKSHVEDSDFQCNDVFRIAKMVGKSNSQVGEDIVNALKNRSDFSNYFRDVVFMNPGFINIQVSDCFINVFLRLMVNDSKALINTCNISETFVLDFGGANVAKPLHVGHMRTAIVGESIKRIINYMGHKTISDVHLGDYGLQIGEVIYGVIKDNKSVDDINIEYLDYIYPYMSGLCKENEDIKNECASITKELQDGNPYYRELWGKILEVSKVDIKKNYDFLDVSFDYWYGESDAYPYLDDMGDILKKRDLIYESNGAMVVSVNRDTDKKEMPPLLFKKSNGAYLYQSTDLATILQRKKDFNPDHILYIVDNRQEMHFEQVFRVSDMARVIDYNSLEFLGYGTVNGEDNKPYKTRNGKSPKLSNLFDDTRRLFISKKESNSNMSDSDLSIIVNSILKFADLSNSRSRDYIFDLNKFSDVTGHTGPYILYTYLRNKKIIDSEILPEEDMSDKIYNEFDRNLRLKLLDITEVMDKAFNERMPHYIADFVYELCVSSNIFYQKNHINGNDDIICKNDWLSLLILVNKIIKDMLYLLGISVPSVM